MLKNENLIKQLEQMQKILIETVQIKTNEIELLKQLNKMKLLINNVKQLFNLSNYHKKVKNTKNLN